ncbi:hypothetical protein M3Y99_01748700 [Aphelenchoides fujianensis]|nr:hypothetical protein M3Y99_01748700 [Aphelenchoides fujianensis]
MDMDVVPLPLGGVQYCNDELTWFNPQWSTNSSIPLPSWCFQHGLLVMIPPAFFFLFLPMLFIQIRLSHARPLPEDLLTSMKQSLTVLLIADRVLLLVRLLWERLGIGQMMALSEYIGPIAQILTLLAILKLKQKLLSHGIASAGVIFLTWLLFVITGLPEFYVYLKLGTDPKAVSNLNTWRYIAYLVWYPLVCLQLLLHCFTIKHFPPSSNPNAKPSPESQSSFLARQFVVWFSRIVQEGKKRPLSTETLYDLDEEMESEHLAQEWNKRWQPAVKLYNRRKEDARSHEAYTSLHTVTEQTPLLKEHEPRLLRYGSHGECRPPTEVHTLEPPSIVLRLAAIFKWQFIGALAAKLVSDVLQYANPLLLGELITYIEDPKAPMWRGIALALLMFASAETRSLLMNNYLGLMLRTAAKMQSILTLAVYSKALKLSHAARHEKSTLGEIVNLMSIDVDRFQNITPQLQQLWSSPFSLTLAIVLLFATLGWPALGGVLLLVLLVPANMIVAVKTKKFQTQQMKCKDERQKLTGELLLNGIRVVKLYAWEEAMMQRINEFRQKELQLIRKAQLIRTIVDILNVASPFLVAMVSFSWFTLSDPNNVLTSRIAFVSLTVFSQLRQPLFLMADLVGQFVQVVVSNRRLKAFLVADELDEEAVLRDHDRNYKNAIEVETATFAWDPRSHSATLRNISLQVESGGRLIVVIGEIGSGKSSLLDVLLGEMEKVQGFLATHGSMAYVPQRPFIQNLTLRENILFNKPYDHELYTKVIDACALELDIAALPDGSETEIGEKGITLSGGQQARVSLARAIYRQADILLLDDPLSATDSIVGRSIFEKALGPGSLSASSTRILVTHTSYPLPFADQIVVMQGGEIARIGTFPEISNDPEFASLIQTLQETPPASGEESPVEHEVEEFSSDHEHEGKSTVSSRSKRTIKSPSHSAKEQKKTLPSRLIAEEFMETSRVKRKVYWAYIQSMGVLLFLIFSVFLTLNSVSTIVRNFWLSDWSNNAGNDSWSLGGRLGVFAALGVVEICFMYGSTVSLIYGSVNSSFRLHGNLLQRIMHAPIWFFDTTPAGRILNRFGKDLEMVDLRLSSTFRFFLICVLNVTSSIVVISISTPLFVLIVIPLAVIYFLTLTYFIPTSRQLQRLTSVTISPLYSSFSETLQGITTIRAYGDSLQFYDQFRAKLDLFIKCKYHALISRIWLGVRLEIMGSVVILSAAALAVLSKEFGYISPGIVGLAVSYSLNMTFMLNFLIRSISEMESNIVAVERIEEYSQVEQEPHTKNHQLKLPKNWPTHGNVVFRQFSARYRAGLDACLKEINLDLGIAGRTGAGKTSFSLALFRLIQPMGGRIVVDGVNIQELDLHDLRSRISCIPQDPILFSGSLRFNLDPFYSHTDAELWSALEDVHLKPFVESLPSALSYRIAEGGSNISVGQRQLICMARAILRKSKIIVFDEATASVDLRTDHLIQQTMREKFEHSTVLTIAHRTETIMDYDRIIVLDHGLLVELDTPQRLMENPKSVFYSMVHSHKAF